MPWHITASNGIHLPQINWYLDARWATARSFVSHAHADHIAAHRKILCSEGTAALLRSRLGGKREEIILPFGVSHELADGVRVVLHPAGHIFGSAQWWSESEEGTLLYTGDFKLRPGRSAEPCATPRADTVIMETTFGRSHYVFPPTDDVLAGIVRFCRDALDDGEIPVLFAYSLGKSQEVLAGLAGAGLRIMLHPQVWKMTQVYGRFAVAFPSHEKFDATRVAGHVVVCPPSVAQSGWLRAIHPRRTAAITGWAMDRGAMYRYQCDAMFPLSDHAGYDDLVRFVELVQPRRVLTVHGFAVEFARDLRARGIEAWALGVANQLELPITVPVAGLPATVAEMKPAAVGEDPVSTGGTFLAFARTGDALARASGKIEKVRLLAEFLRPLPDPALQAAALFFTGRPFSQASGRALHLGWAAIKRALLAVAGLSEGEFRAAYARTGDGGDAAELVLQGRTAPHPWKLEDVAACFETMAGSRGPLARIDLLESALRGMTPLEAKFLIKIITGDLRIGLKEGLLEEALGSAFDCDLTAVRDAHLRSGDLARVAHAARHHRLDAVELAVFHPLQCMLASPEPDAAAIVRRFGAAVWIEEKYDGIRCQIHKQGARAELYSRELRVMSAQFPELVQAALRCPHDFVADAELLAWRDGRALPFLELQRRLGRRGDDFFLGEEVPVTLSLFDLLWFDGRNLLREALTVRRALLEAAAFAPGLSVAPRWIAHDAAEINAAFLAARSRGNEGLIAKDPQSAYTPGRRGFSWAKLKQAFATLDVVVTGVEYGHGKRHGVLSDYTFSIRDQETGALRTVGKAYSGLTDAEIARLTEHFLATTIEERGRYRQVQPEVILEVAFDTIQASSRHESGFALRFPRIVRIRDDKAVAEIDTLETCRRLAAAAKTTVP